MKKIIFFAVLFMLFAVSVFGQNGKPSDVQGFYIYSTVDYNKPELGFPKYMVMTGTIRSGSGPTYLVTFKDEVSETNFRDIPFKPGYADDKNTPKEIRDACKDLRKKTIWKEYPGDGRYEIFMGAGYILGFRRIK